MYSDLRIYMKEKIEKESKSELVQAEELTAGDKVAIILGDIEDDSEGSKEIVEGFIISNENETLTIGPEMTSSWGDLRFIKYADILITDTGVRTIERLDKGRG